MAVDERQRARTVTYPRFAAIPLGTDVVGCEETVLYGDRAVGIAHVATIVTAVLSIKSTVELTVTEIDTGTSIDSGYETTVSGIAIHTAVDVD